MKNRRHEKAIRGFDTKQLLEFGVWDLGLAEPSEAP